MIMEIKGATRSFIYFLLLFLVITCSPDQSDDVVPYIAFPEIVLPLNLPENNSIRTDGGYRLLSSSLGGVQGIIVYRVNAGTYLAYERNCTYHPNDACVAVDVHPSGLYMHDPCCGSSFDFANGNPTGGPAWRPLRQYETVLSGSTLTITDTILE
jgi:nitrite reductase/ring-hydroxylating ferredoxin subunit